MIDKYNLDWRSALLALFIIVLLVALICLASTATHAQSNTCANGDQLVINTSTKLYQCITPGTQPAGTGTTMLVANETITGTTVNRLAKLTGAPSTAIITATSDTENAVGIVASGAGTTGNATITILGQASCEFDGATTAGDYFTISATTAGKCHDAGAAFPTSGATYGRVLSTNGAGGTFIVELMTPDIAFQNAGNGKSKPGTPATSFQFNNSNTFAGGNLFEEDANTVAQRNGITTQVFNLYDEFTSSSNFQRLQLHKNASSQFELLSDNQTQSAMELAFKVNGASGALVLGSGDLRPASNRLYNLGSSTSNMFNQLFIFRIDLNGDGLFFTSGPQFVSGGGGWLQMKDTANSANLTRISMGDTGTSGVSLTKPASSTYFEDRNGDNSAYVFHVNAGNEFTSAQFDKVNATLADVTGLTSETLTAGKTYSFFAELFVDADVTGGSKYAIAGTATATAIKYHIDMICDATNALVITSRQTALAGSAGQAGCTAGLTRISGTITVNAAGTLAVQFAQNAANGTSSVLTMSKFEVRQLN